MSVLAMDCEVVETGTGNPNLNRVPVELTRVSIVDRQGNVLLDEHRIFVSGIKGHNLDNGKSIKQVKSDVFNMILDNELVGKSLDKDLYSVLINHPECYRYDISKYEPFMKNGQPQSLKDLAKIYLDKNIDEGEYDTVENARIAMELYELVADKWDRSNLKIKFK